MVRQGLIPSALGTAVTAAGVAMRVNDMKKNGMNKREMFPLLSAGIIGFGLAHIVLGGIDLYQHRF
ncbi:asparagine synthase [Dehalobacter sp. DCM]|uniref:asparagine synthase n=1 Tax=Dehalobacter sp. DCM TaxID=2907827 RepID=UPI0030814C54|nr:asparagine synthase [Dehalobacter sp. DCM]